MPCFPRKIMLIVLIKLWECTRNLLPTLQKTCCQLFRKYVCWKYVANFYLEICCKPPLKIRTLVVASPPCWFPRGASSWPNLGENDKNDNLLFNPFPLPLSQSALLMSVRHHCPSDVINLQCSLCQRCFRGWAPGFVFDIFISFLAIGFSVLWNLMLGWCICIVFVFSLASSQATDAIFCTVHAIFIS